VSVFIRDQVLKDYTFPVKRLQIYCLGLRKDYRFTVWAFEKTTDLIIIKLIMSLFALTPVLITDQVFKRLKFAGFGLRKDDRFTVLAFEKTTVLIIIKLIMPLFALTPVLITDQVFKRLKFAG
jgi:hypothetical protein